MDSEFQLTKKESLCFKNVFGHICATGDICEDGWIESCGMRARVTRDGRFEMVGAGFRVTEELPYGHDGGGVFIGEGNRENLRFSIGLAGEDLSQESL